jgi:major type 1 subunit fimbrin (pilin)
MKKTYLSVIMACSLMTVAGMSHAADGTVRFVGNIIADACEVDTASKDMTVVLGNVATTSFSAAGDKSSPTAFTIKLLNCPSTVTKVSAKFDGLSDVANSDLLMLDSGMTATNVGIEIADTNGNPIPLHTSSPEYVIGSDSSADLNFVARYVSTAASVGAGTANGTTQFTINYQ